MLDSDHIKNLFSGTHHDPFAFLGLHYKDANSIIRVFNHHALKVDVFLHEEDKKIEMKSIGNRDFY